MQWAPHLGADAPVLPKEDKGQIRTRMPTQLTSPKLNGGPLG
jgi:hypothetical protein